MANIIFKRGTTEKIRAADKIDGQILVDKTTGEMYNDIGDKRLKVTDTSKQDKLISGQNIKTINDQSLLGSGNIKLNKNLVFETKEEMDAWLVAGKNLCPPPPEMEREWYEYDSNDEIKNTYKYKVSTNPDGTFNIEGVYDETSGAVHSSIILPPGTYCFSCSNNLSAEVNTGSEWYGAGDTFILTKEQKVWAIVWDISANNPTNAWFQIEEGTEATEFEPYSKNSMNLKEGDILLVKNSSFIYYWDGSKTVDMGFATKEELNTFIDKEKISISLDKIIDAQNYFLKAKIVKSGTTGECTWTLDSKGVLTISDSGDMENYTPSNEAPWGKNITKVIIEDGVDSIGNYAFYECEHLIDIDILSWNLTSIGDQAFSNCSSLTSIWLPDNVDNIGDYAFANCTSLKTVQGSYDSTVYIGDSAFSNCKSLISINLAEIAGIGSYAFEDCINLTSIANLEGITKIEFGTFYGCSSLTNIILPNSITFIDPAFYNCSSLTTVYYTGSEDDKDKITIRDDDFDGGNNALINATWICNYIG